MNITKAKAKKSASLAGAVASGLVIAALIKKQLPDYAAYANLVAGLGISMSSNSDFLQVFGATHAAVGAIDAVRKHVPTLPGASNLPQVNGMGYAAALPSAMGMGELDEFAADATGLGELTASDYEAIMAVGG